MIRKDFIWDDSEKVKFKFKWRSQTKERWKFDGLDFDFCKIQVEDYLYRKKLQQPNRQTHIIIRLSLSQNIAFNIAKKKITANFMKALSRMYEKSLASNKFYLIRQLFTLQMTKDTSLEQHISELNIVTT